MLCSKIKVLSKKDLDSIHFSSLKILKDIGVKVENERLLFMLRDIGCIVEKGSVVKFPESVIEKIVEEMRTIKKIKTKEVISSGEKEALQSRRAEIEDNIEEVKFYASGQSLYALDLETDEIRLATKKDLVDATRLVSALPNIGLMHPVFIPQDTPPMTRDIHALEVVALNYPDSRCVEVFSLETLEYFVEIGTIIRGSMEELRKNPCFSYVLFSDTPLRFSKGNLEIALRLHDLGLSSAIGGVMVLPGANTPVTLSGALVVQNAEVLAANVINKVLNNKLRGYCVIPTTIDMAKGVSSQGAPELSLLSLASIQLMNYYGLPISGWAPFNTDSKLPDIQAGLEKVYSAILSLIAGVRSFCSVGVLGGAQIASLVQIIIDAEFADLVKRLLAGIDCSKERLAMDVIKRIGIGGNFLEDEHTFKYFRKELWFPQITDRKSVNDWLKNKETMVDKAKEKAKKILREYIPHPSLSKEQIKEIKRAVKKADEKLNL